MLLSTNCDQNVLDLGGVYKQGVFCDRVWRECDRQGQSTVLGYRGENNIMLQNDKGYAADLSQTFYHAERVCGKSATRK